MGAEAPPVFSPRSLRAYNYTQVTAYGSDAVHDLIRAAEAPTTFQSVFTPL